MPIRVVIVDDSPFAREVLREVLSRFPDIEVVGEASDGNRAARLVSELVPDVVTMDVIMPMVGGLDAIRSIMSVCPTPIIVVSDAHSDLRSLAMRAIEVGAIDVFAKPSGGFDQIAAETFAAVVRSAAQADAHRRSEHSRPPHLSQRLRARRVGRASMVGIVASTGGPQTLRRIISRLSRRRSPPIAVVQHTSIGFTKALVSWLASEARVRVTVARDRQQVERGTVVVAPDDTHLEIEAGGITRLHQGPAIGSHRPSGTLLLRSLARSFGAGGVGVVLTGMGTDGAEGAHELELRGGLVVVEDPSTAILEGMPRAAIQRTQAPLVASASRIGRYLCPTSDKREP
ncbi:chemotaxis protein CheB [Haliangium sp.]|uniref:chemotaxis protein CheB n=1 Tax=Haliangium sp. TaxID=2663208 RepID=UPI003D0FD400